MPSKYGIEYTTARLGPTSSERTYVHTPPTGARGFFGAWTAHYSAVPPTTISYGGISIPRGGICEANDRVICLYYGLDIRTRANDIVDFSNVVTGKTAALFSLVFAAGSEVSMVNAGNCSWRALANSSFALTDTITNPAFNLAFYMTAGEGSTPADNGGHNINGYAPVHAEQGDFDTGGMYTQADNGCGLWLAITDKQTSSVTIGVTRGSAGKARTDRALMLSFEELYVSTSGASSSSHRRNRYRRAH